MTIASIPAILTAQSGSSTVAGIVRDSSGATIPGGHARIINAATGVTLDTFLFNLSGAMLGAADFGVISRARPARTIQSGLRLGF